MYPTNTNNPSHHHVYGQNVHHHQAQHPAYASQAGHHYSSLSAATTNPTDVMDSSSAVAAHQAHQLQQQQQAALYHHSAATAAHHQHAQRSPAHYAQSIGSGTSSPSSDPEPSFPAPGPSSAGSSRGGGGKRSPESMIVPIDAPTQPRRYITPSSTSRKEVPAFFTKRRSASSATSPYGALHQLQYSDEEDELTEEPPSANATDQEKIEWKRRQNTLAARRSRKRKMMHQQFLEDRVDTLTVEKEVWKTRAQTLRQLLISNGIPCPDWSD